MADINYADGLTHEVTQGAAEIQEMLDSTSRRNQILLVDFAASWCGPCRMLAPILEQLAREFSNQLAVAKIDCEVTPANRSFAADSGISAFPTLKLFRGGKEVNVQRGANPQALRQAIQQQIGLLGSGSAAAAGPSAAAANKPLPPPGPLCRKLAAELQKLKAGCSHDEFLTACKTLITFISNAINNPNEPKYRKIRLSNASFDSKLGSKPSGKEAMIALGFEQRTEADEQVLVMDRIDPELPVVIALLQSAMGGGGGGQATPPPRQVDAAALSAAMAGATGGGVSGSVPTTAAANRPPRRRILITPARLAKLLEQILLDGGFAAQPSAPPPPAADAAPPS